MLVQVWNDHEYLHREKFEDEMIEIPSKAFVTMDMDKAIQFRGQFFPPALDGDGNMIPIAVNDHGKPQIGKGGYKMIRIVDPSNKTEPTTKEVDMMALKCPVCGFMARSKWELEGHTADLHIDAMEDDDAKKEIQEKLKKRRGNTAEKKNGEKDI